MLTQAQTGKALQPAKPPIHPASILSQAFQFRSRVGSSSNEGEPYTVRPVSSLAWGAMLILCIAVCFAAAATGAIATNESVNTWYRMIARPAWTPPDWVFGPVWTTLYLMMAVAVWLVWCQAGFRAGRWPLSLFALQLALNVIWSFVFFALQSPGWAFGEILLLWVALASTIVSFWHHSRVAALLLVPYFCWSSFAAVLNFTIWRLNA